MEPVIQTLLNLILRLEQALEQSEQAIRVLQAAIGSPEEQM